ncbi:hypothetical protein GCM10023347_22350 [Streptomyces chumphonensis]|uniref:Uncharacterized protein n=1 Tax=Streptomyces chumphonensis TaxID=1214925 RepID=A0A927IBM5_9ACTN|nr:hypothetical protein [Streptomyces chumphonensis]MBD3931035.1 hypothetical protein [Streptomyces chumphonensis]
MTVPEFDVDGVPVRRPPRTLTRAGQVLVQGGRMSLLTSYGREIDGAPVEKVRLPRPWWGAWRPARRRTVVVLGGTRYTLGLALRDRSRLTAALGHARERAAKIAADRRIVHP